MTRQAGAAGSARQAGVPPSSYPHYHCMHVYTNNSAAAAAAKHHACLPLDIYTLYTAAAGAATGIAIIL